jgi:hypothetical protein
VGWSLKHLGKDAHPLLLPKEMKMTGDELVDFANEQGKRLTEMLPTNVGLVLMVFHKGPGTTVAYSEEDKETAARKMQEFLGYKEAWQKRN